MANRTERNRIEGSWMFQLTATWRLSWRIVEKSFNMGTFSMCIKNDVLKIISSVKSWVWKRSDSVGIKVPQNLLNLWSGSAVCTRFCSGLWCRTNQTLWSHVQTVTVCFTNTYTEFKFAAVRGNFKKGEFLLSWFLFPYEMKIFLSSDQCSELWTGSGSPQPRCSDSILFSRFYLSSLIFLYLQTVY